MSTVSAYALLKILTGVEQGVSVFSFLRFQSFLRWDVPPGIIVGRVTSAAECAPAAEAVETTRILSSHHQHPPPHIPVTPSFKSSVETHRVC